MRTHGAQCPVCLSDGSMSIGGDLHRCLKCKIAFNSAYDQKHYGTEYFIEEYRNQYGKTYLEDYETIAAFSKNRLAAIFNYLKSKKDTPKISLLDIGSAAGFFLQAAKEYGLSSLTGIEISEFASRYCREHFNIPVIQKSFQDVTLDDSYTIITAWFFIEHTRDPAGTLKKIYDALDPGGIFAFAVPSIFGPSYHFKRSDWIKNHPSDHRIDLSPAGARLILKKCGFRKVHVQPAAIHPERIVNPSSFLFLPFSLLYGVFSRMTGYSDTIEVYALK